MCPCHYPGSQQHPSGHESPASVSPPLLYAMYRPVFVLASKQVFAELTGVSVMVQRRPYAERMPEFRPFACSDFIIPMLTKLCPPGEKMDRCGHR